MGVLFEYHKEIQEKDLNFDSKYLGLDFFHEKIIVVSNDTSENYPRFYRQSLEKLARERRKLSKIQKGVKTEINNNLK